MSARDLIAAFSARRRPAEMRPEVFRQALSLADLDLLHSFVGGAEGFERFARALVRFPTIERLHLLPTRPREGVSALDWLPLLRAFLKSRGLACEVRVDPDNVVLLGQDDQVLQDALTAARRILSAIPATEPPAPILADLSTGARTVSLALALACLQEEREVQFLGIRYDAEGGAPPEPIAFSRPL
ncbi:MAG TPA: hypothetical protein VGK45_06440 [Thermoanaerobaculia bacterium]